MTDRTNDTSESTGDEARIARLADLNDWLIDENARLRAALIAVAGQAARTDRSPAPTVPQDLPMPNGPVAQTLREECAREAEKWERRAAGFSVPAVKRTARAEAARWRRLEQEATDAE